MDVVVSFSRREKGLRAWRGAHYLAFFSVTPFLLKTKTYAPRQGLRSSGATGVIPARVSGCKVTCSIR